MDHDLFAGMGGSWAKKKPLTFIPDFVESEYIYDLETKHLFYLILNLFVRQGVTL